MSIRIERIGEQIRSELARLLREEVSDPRVGLLSLTRVKVSPDLSTALVFWSPLDIDGETDLVEMEQGLASAAGFLRSRLGSLLPLRRTPQVTFRYDRSLDEGARTLALLRSLPDIANAPKDSAPTGDDESPIEGPAGAGLHGEEA